MGCSVGFDACLHWLMSQLNLLNIVGKSEMLVQIYYGLLTLTITPCFIWHTNNNLLWIDITLAKSLVDPRCNRLGRASAFPCLTVKAWLPVHCSDLLSIPDGLQARINHPQPTKQQLQSMNFLFFEVHQCSSGHYVVVMHVLFGSVTRQVG